MPGDKFITGTFCAIAKGIEFIMNGADHRMDGVTTYPFYIMGGDWGSALAPDKDELIDCLLELKWWDWPIEKIEANYMALSSGDLSLIRPPAP